MLVGVIAVFAAIVVFQAPGMIKRKMWGELAVFSIILSLGMIYSLGLIYGWALPNPTKRMEHLVEPMWNKVVELLS